MRKLKKNDEKWETAGAACVCVLWESLASGCTGTSVSFHLNFGLLFRGRNSFKHLEFFFFFFFPPLFLYYWNCLFPVCRCSASSCASTWLEMPFFYRHKKLCNQLHTSLEIYYVSLEARPPLTRLPWISFSFSFSWFIFISFPRPLIRPLPPPCNRSSTPPPLPTHGAQSHS